MIIKQLTPRSTFGRALDYVMRSFELSLRANGYPLSHPGPTGKKSNVIFDRPIAPEVVMGHAVLQMSAAVSDLAPDDYMSYVFTHAPQEDFADARQRLHCIRMFMRALLPGLSVARVALVAVQHRHAGLSELHLLIPKRCLSSGKVLSLDTPASRKRIATVQTLLNEQFAWSQPTHTSRRRLIKLDDVTLKSIRNQLRFRRAQPVASRVLLGLRPLIADFPQLELARALWREFSSSRPSSREALLRRCGVLNLRHGGVSVVRISKRFVDFQYAGKNIKLSGSLLCAPELFDYSDLPETLPPGGGDLFTRRSVKRKGAEIDLYERKQLVQSWLHFYRLTSAINRKKFGELHIHLKQKLQSHLADAGHLFADVPARVAAAIDAIERAIFSAQLARHMYSGVLTPVTTVSATINAGSGLPPWSSSGVEPAGAAVMDSGVDYDDGSDSVGVDLLHDNHDEAGVPEIPEFHSLGIVDSGRRSGMSI